MKYRAVGVFLLLYLAIMFGISLAWEFWLEDLVMPYFFSKFRAESLSEQWKYIFTANIFALLSLIIPTLLMLRSISDRQRIEKNQERLVSILHATPDMVNISTRQGESIFFNRSAREMMGIGEGDDVAHIHFVDCHAPSARQAILEVAIPAAIEDGVWIGESEVISADGERIPVSEVIVAHRNNSGEVDFLSTICRDITSQKEIERLKSDFVSIVSHELRTPLTAIRSSLSIITGEMDLNLPEEAGEMLNIALANTNRLVRLINDILDLEKIEYTRLDLTIDTIDAYELVATTLAELKPMADQAGVELRPEVQEGTQLEGDRDRLVQVITNLVGNAIKFSEPGDTVEIKALGLPDKCVRFEIHDHGPGIHWDHIPKLFGKFQQLGSPQNRTKKGTGLGLAISKAIIDHHSGRIGVESEVGKGSLFYFELPPKQPVDRESSA